MTITLDLAIDEDAPARFQAVAAPDENFDAFLADTAKNAVRDALMRRERQAAGRAEMQAMLDGPRHTAAEVKERMRLKYGYEDLSHLTRDELMEQAEAALAALPPEKIAEAERLGLI